MVGGYGITKFRKIEYDCIILIILKENKIILKMYIFNQYKLQYKHYTQAFL